LRIRGTSLFNRLFLAFVASGIIVAAPLILLSYRVNMAGALLRLEQTVGQQLFILGRSFEQEFSQGLVRSLLSIEHSEALAAYHLSSEDERLVTRKALENSLLRMEEEYGAYSGIYYIDRDGNFVSGVENGQRSSLARRSGEGDDATQNVLSSWRRTPFRELFLKVRTTPVLLSSGNMEWFMPPREVFVEGPFFDEDGRLSFLAGRATVDPDSGGFGGVVVIRATLDEFLRRLREVVIYDHRPINLLDQYGNPLLLGADGKPFAPAPAGLPSARSAEVQLERSDDSLVASLDLSIIPNQLFARLTYFVPAALIQRDTRPDVWFLIGPLGAAILLVGALAFAVSRRISMPIIRLASASADLAHGGAQGGVDVKADGEIGVLIDSFNDMSAQLQAAQVSRASALSVLRDTAARLSGGRDGAAFSDGDASGGAQDPAGSDVRDLRRIERLLKRLIAEREETLQSLEAAKETADRANLAKDDFLATMSHEIRTPLNAIIGIADILHASRLDPEQANLLRTMQSSGNQLMRLINDVLDFSRLQSGHVELEPTAVDLEPFVDRLLQVITGLPGADRLRIAAHLEPDVPRHLMIDEARLNQILINLMGNAVKFTPTGSIDLRISLNADGPASLRFAVIDTGVGIDPAYREQIFEPFRQGRAERLRPHAGTGLGLSICRRLAQAMDGRLELESTGTSGSCFVVTLPFTAAPEASAMAQAAEGAQAEGQPGLDILVAEDTPANQTVIRMMLQKLGHRVTMVANGQEAVDAFARDRFDLVFLDIQMPVMDGFEAATRIRARGDRGRATPLVALTAFSQAADRERAYECGLTQFVSKPVRIAQIAQVIAATRPGAGSSDIRT
jgi:signal transduction histidine kinase/ActR/RegA family two-component response regulator